MPADCYYCETVPAHEATAWVQFADSFSERPVCAACLDRIKAQVAAGTSTSITVYPLDFSSLEMFDAPTNSKEN